jgi:Zn-finger nucleic acid-binding protein
MKCNSCSEEVLAKFQYAISTNSCPYCGGQIVDPNVQIIINDLKAVLNKASEHMDQIEDWLFTNFQLRKLKEDEVVINKNELPATVRDEERQQGKGKGVNVRRSRDGDEDEGVSLSPKKAIDIIRGKASSGLADPSEFRGVDDEGNEIDLGSEAGEGLDRGELGQMSNLFGDGIQLDPKESARADAHLQKLKSMRRG